MQGEALLKIGGILEKLSNDITILKNNSIGISGGSRDCNSNPSNSIQPKQSKPRSRSNYRSNSSTSNKKMKRPILRSTSQRRRAANKPTKRGSLKKKQVKRKSKPKSSNKKNNKRR